MTRAILTCFHKYQPYGGEFYKPILDFFLANLNKFKDEFDTLYILDSTWDIKRELPEWVKVIKVDPSLRYYDAYKEVLPQVQEEMVLLMDDDMVVYKPGIIKKTFALLENDIANVVSIYDTIGDRRDPRLNKKSKFCPYWFAAKTELLMQFRDCEWGPVPWGETLSELTFKMLEAGCKPYEWPEDKSSLLFNGDEHWTDHHKEGGLGYYHIRAGSVPAVLLAYKYHDTVQYQDYIQNQPKNEILRQAAWYDFMGGQALEIAVDLGIKGDQWADYCYKFKKYHGL